MSRTRPAPRSRATRLAPTLQGSIPWEMLQTASPLALCRLLVLLPPRRQPTSSAAPRSVPRTSLPFDTFTKDDYLAGAKTVSPPPSAAFKVFDKIVATATDSLTAAAGGGPANTSEFAPSVTIVSPWKNPGRLRWDVNDDTHVAA